MAHNNFALMENEQLIEAHAQIHSLVEGSGPEKCAEIRQEHDIIVAEFVRRGIPHGTGIICPEAEAVTDAPNYRRSFVESNCSNCVFGQVLQWCSLYNFEYVPNFTCDSWETIQTIELERPHGYLVWKGKQTAIASDKVISDSEPFLITSKGEAFGVATLSKPAQMNENEFNRPEWFAKHRVYRHEHPQIWPDAKMFYVHKIAKFEPFEKAQLFVGGKVISEEITNEQKKLLLKCKRLPKQISLIDNVVSLVDGNAFDIHELAKNNRELNTALKAVYEMEVQQAESGDETIPLYSLSLVRNPKMRVSKKNSIGDDMPEEISQELVIKLLQSFDKGIIPEDEKQELLFAIVEDEGRQCVVRLSDDSNVMCYEGESALERAEALLNMLNMTEAEVEIEEEAVHLDDEDEDEDKDEGKQFTDEPWDGSAARWPTADEYCEDTLIDVNPSGEDKIKGLCKLPFRDPGTTNPNINAVRAIGGGNGITATEKPASVSQEEWDSQLESAANRVITWWPEAFDNEAPEGVFRLAGRERPEEDESDKQQSLVMSGEVGINPGKTGTLLWSKSEEKAGRRIGKNWLVVVQKAKEALSDLLSWGSYDEAKEDVAMFSTPSGYIAVKGKDGKPWHFTWSTNAFEDREGEIFSTKALEQYALEQERKEQEAKKKGKEYHRGFFNLWHINEGQDSFSSDFAEKKWQGVVGRFLVESGPYLDDHKGQSALKFFSKYSDGHPEIAPEGWGCSPEFKFLPEERETGIFDWLFITKTSTLPRAAAANIWTEAKQQENVMALSEQQKESAVEIFGKDYVSSMLDEGKAKTKELEEADVAHKSEDEPKLEVNVEELISKQLPTLEQIAEEVGKQFSADQEPFVIALTSLSESMKAIESKVAELEKYAEVKQAAETPRYVFGMQRASTAEETVVAENDGLKDQKPQESEGKNTDSAAHFFGSK